MVYKFNSTGALAMVEAVSVPAGQNYKLISVTLKMSAGPGTSEEFTITLDANAGTPYDTQLYALDLSTAPTTDLVWTPAVSTYDPLILEGGDALDFAFTNTDADTWGLQVTMQRV